MNSSKPETAEPILPMNLKSNFKVTGKIEHNNAHCLQCQISPRVYMIFFTQLKQQVSNSFYWQDHFVCNMSGLAIELLHIL